MVNLYHLLIFKIDDVHHLYHVNNLLPTLVSVVQSTFAVGSQLMCNSMLGDRLVKD